MNYLYYDMATERWVQNETNEELFLGRNNQLLPYSGSISHTMLPFPSININNEKVGPLIGTLTGSSKKGFIGNVRTLVRLQKELHRQGALCITFTPASINKDFIEGFYYLQHKQQWIKVRTPFPDVVYNRIPYRSMEQEPTYKETLEFLEKHNIPYFNPGFFSKWEIYQILTNNKIIANYLPYTVLYDREMKLVDMLNDYKVIYAKTIKGHQGKGIWKITANHAEILAQTPEKEYRFTTLAEALKFLHPIFHKEKYILQQAVIPDKYEGKRYDLRILSHFNQAQDKYIISGIGIRLSGDQQITTHVPNGGSIIPYSLLDDRLNLLLLQTLINEIGIQLSKGFNQIIGEFSLDIGKSREGLYYIYEVNSKPMVFDEPHIRTQGVENLASLLISLSNY
jgi:hypothetical protein